MYDTISDEDLFSASWFRALRSGMGKCFLGKGG